MIEQDCGELFGMIEQDSGELFLLNYWFIVDSTQYMYSRYLDLSSLMIETFFKPPSIFRDMARHNNFVPPFISWDIGWFTHASTWVRQTAPDLKVIRY